LLPNPVAAHDTSRHAMDGVIKISKENRILWNRPLRVEMGKAAFRVRCMSIRRPDRRRSHVGKHVGNIREKLDDPSELGTPIKLYRLVNGGPASWLARSHNWPLMRSIRKPLIASKARFEKQLALAAAEHDPD